MIVMVRQIHIEMRMIRTIGETLVPMLVEMVVIMVEMVAMEVAVMAVPHRQ